MPMGQEGSPKGWRGASGVVWLAGECFSGGVGLSGCVWDKEGPIKGEVIVYGLGKGASLAIE